MVEVFKTNVTEPHHAKMLVEQIHKNFTGYKANFDLDDCDNILRILCVNGTVESSFVIDLLNELGFDAEVLPDELPLADTIVEVKAKPELKRSSCFSDYFDFNWQKQN